MHSLAIMLLCDNMFRSMIEPSDRMQKSNGSSRAATPNKASVRQREQLADERTYLHAVKVHYITWCASIIEAFTIAELDGRSGLWIAVQTKIVSTSRSSKT